MQVEFNEQQFWTELKKLVDTIKRTKDPLTLSGLNEALDARLKRAIGKATYLPKSVSDNEKVKAAFGDLPIEDDTEEVSPVMAAVDAAENAEPPSKDTIAEAENLIRQARVASMRNDRKEAVELLRKAASLAPTSAPVLEALGDEEAANRNIDEAMKLYKRALELDPKNIGLDRKHANLVFNRTQGELVSSGFIAKMEKEEGSASPKAAMFLSVFVPGLGHFVSGRVQRGAIYVGLILLAWAIVFTFGWNNVAYIFSGRPAKNHISFIAFIIAIAVHLVCIFDAYAGAKVEAVTRVRPDRPKPPSDLPFE
ncbi:MAG: tetratricopeptide repeat protein [Fimbriimonadaceae bacterium]|nr:tetratricopeptide repeat protein [Fimbriimonadaceae bacterium]